MSSPLARREQERFSGWIAGLGTASGHRLVVGHWPTSPFGMVTDVMVEDPGGHRTLYAPTPQLAAFLGAAYRFDDVQRRRACAKASRTGSPSGGLVSAAGSPRASRTPTASRA